MNKLGTIKGDLLAQVYNRKQNKQMFSKTAVLAAAIATATNALNVRDDADDNLTKQANQWTQLKDLSIKLSSTAENCF